MSSIPTKLKIGHLHFDVIWSPELSKENTPAWGYCSPLDQALYLDASLKSKPQRAKEIFIHELLHALMDQYHPEAANIDPRVEESIVAALAAGLATVLVDNNRLGKYLCSKP